MTGRFQKQTGYYADSPAGYGARQAPSMSASRQRYRQRREGKIEPVQYGTLKEAEAALS